MSIISRVKKEIRSFRQYGVMGVICHHLNPQRLKGHAYRFPRESSKRKKWLKWVACYDKLYFRIGAGLLGVKVMLCVICIKISMVSPLK